MKTPAALILFAAPLFAQPTLSISGPTANVKPGTPFTLTFAITGTAGTGDQALQFSVSSISGWTILATPGQAIVAAGKQLTCAYKGNLYSCVADGGISTMNDGQVASLQVTLPPTTPGGTTQISLSELLAANTDTTGKANGAPVTAGSPFSLNITSSCDLNSDGKTDSLDLAIVRAQALGSGACLAGDLNLDLKCNIVDVQTMNRAISTGICNSIPGQQRATVPGPNTKGVKK